MAGAARIRQDNHEQQSLSGAKSASEQWQQAREWLVCPPVWIPQPTERHAEVLGELLSLPGMGGNLVTDAHLAALAIEHGLTLCSADTRLRTVPETEVGEPVGVKWCLL